MKVTKVTVLERFHLFSQKTGSRELNGDLDQFTMSFRIVLLSYAFVKTTFGFTDLKYFGT